jgi:hypothetical protein
MRGALLGSDDEDLIRPEFSSQYPDDPLQILEDWSFFGHHGPRCISEEFRRSDAQAVGRLRETQRQARPAQSRIARFEGYGSGPNERRHVISSERDIP